MRAPSLICTCLCFFLVLCVCIVTFPEDHENATALFSQTSDYPDTADGLRQLVQDLLRSVQSADGERFHELAESLILPDYQQWFVKVLGLEDGNTLAKVYETRIPQHEPRLHSFLVEMSRKADWKLEVERMPETPSAEPHRIMDALRESRREPVAFYVASFLNPSGSGPNLGYFVYVEGAFRRIDVGVLSALSTLKPRPAHTFKGTDRVPRIRVNTQTMNDRILHKVEPRYPEEAARKGIEGTVQLEILVDTHGVVQEIKQVAGPPLLGEAAVEAVRQWRFSPVELNGQAVEVISRINIIFAFGKTADWF